MKTNVILAAAVIARLTQMKRNPEAVTQACEAFQNSRTEVSNESIGTKNRKKTQLAESGALVKFQAKSSVVSQFIEYAEASVGAVARHQAKGAKLGLVESPIADFPPLFAEWLQSPGFDAKPATPAKPAHKPAAKPAAATVAA